MKTSHLLVGLATVGTFGAFVASSAFAATTAPRAVGPLYTPERHTAMEAAFDAKDYAAWSALMQGRGATRVVTAENFPTFARAHELADSGNLVEAQQLRASIGLYGAGAGAGRGTGVGGGYGRGGGCLR